MSVFSVVGPGKLLKKYKPRVDNIVFRLCYRATVVLFFISSVLVTAREFVGKPIQCEAKAKEIKGELLNTYCYIMSTFSIPTEWNKTIGNVAYPGTGTLNEENAEVVFHSYYMWVPFVLVFQGISFYLPHFLWKKFDGGVFFGVVDGLPDQAIISPKNLDPKIKSITKFLLININQNNKYAYMFFFCEALNFVAVLANMYFTDYFLGGNFFKYGRDVMNYAEMDPENGVNPMTKIFPKMAKCTFRKYGASGTLEIHDAFCLLAVNIINEKIYIVLWFWLWFVLTVTTLWLLFRIVIICSKPVRKYLLEWRGRAAGRNNLRILTERLKIGDWFLVYQLGRQMEPMVYGEFLKDFAGELENSLATLERKPMLSS